MEQLAQMIVPVIDELKFVVFHLLIVRFCQKDILKKYILFTQSFSQ